jgi:hypothetical protein
MITIKHIDNETVKHTTNVELTSLVNRLLYSYFYISVAPLDMRVLRSSDKVITSITIEVPLPKMYDSYMMTRLTQVFQDEFSQEKYQNDKNEFIKVKFIF